MVDLLSLGTVEVESSKDAGHSHAVKISLIAPKAYLHILHARFPECLYSYPQFF
ncbi:MAG: hypothetical protein ACK5WZ_12230 [Pseudobdellovibrionaceae bacterium]